MITLTIGFSKPRGDLALFGKAIMLYNRSKFSHCYVRFETAFEVPMISQASKGMVNFMSIPAFEKNNHIVEEFKIEVTPEQMTAIKMHSMHKAGLPYSVKQIVGIVIADIFNLKTNPFDKSPDTLVCSEYLAQIAGMLGVELDKDSSLISPKEMNKAFHKAYEGKFVL